MARNEKGFTLIELVMIIVILGILAAIALPKYEDLRSDARRSVVNGVSGAVKSSAAIQLAKNNGALTSKVNVVTTMPGFEDYKDGKVTLKLDLAGATVLVVHEDDTAVQQSVDLTGLANP